MSTTPTRAPPVIKVGSRVYIPEKPQMGKGTVRFLGPVKFSSKDNWVGVELDAANGKNNGSVMNIVYFTCKENYGLFIARDKLALVPKAATPKTGTKPSPLKLPTTSSTPASPTVSSTTSSTTSSTSTTTPHSVLSPPTSAPSSPRGGTGVSSLTPSPSPTPPSSAPVSPRVTPATKPPVAKDTKDKDVLEMFDQIDKEQGSTSSSGMATPVEATGEKKTIPTKTEAGSSGASATAAAPKTPLTKSGPTTKPAPSTPEVRVTTPTQTSPSSSAGSSEQSGAGDAAALRLLMPDAENILRSLQELSEWKKDAQEKMKQLTKTITELSKEKDNFAKEVEKEKKEREKEIAKMAKQFERDKEQLQKAWAEEKEELEEENQTLNESLESLTLDKEFAEEKAESMEKELEKLKLKLNLKDPSGTNGASSSTAGGNKDDLSDGDSDLSDEEYDSEGRRRERGSRAQEDDPVRAELKDQVQRLTDALMKLKDLSVIERRESEKKAKQLERDLGAVPVLEDKVAKLKEEAKKSDAKIDDLKAQLDVALEAEEMIAELSDQKLTLEETVAEMQQTIDDLEAMKDLSEELEENHAHAEKQLQTALYKKELQLVENVARMQRMQAEIDDRDKTIEQFREKVAELQGQLMELEEKEETQAEEARSLASKSQALLDQNIQLKSKVMKATAMAIDGELLRFESMQAGAQLSVMQQFVPEEAFVRDMDAIALHLLLDRFIFKSKLILHYLQSFYKLDQNAFNLINNIELPHTHAELLFVWNLHRSVSSVRFSSSRLRKAMLDPSICDMEAFLKLGRLGKDLVPMESSFDAVLYLIKREELSSAFDLTPLKMLQERIERINRSALSQRRASGSASPMVSKRQANFEKALQSSADDQSDSSNEKSKGGGNDSGSAESDTATSPRALERVDELLDMIDRVQGEISLTSPPADLAATCPTWRSMRYQVEGLVMSLHRLLLVWGQVKEEAKLTHGPNDALRVTRDVLDICKKLLKFIQDKPQLPRHYATKLEGKLGRCSRTVDSALTVLQELLVRLRSQATTLAVTGSSSSALVSDEMKQSMVRQLLQELVPQLLPKSSSLAGPQDDDDGAIGLERGKEKETEDSESTSASSSASASANSQQDEQEQGAVMQGEAPGSEWAWLNKAMAGMLPVVTGVSDQIMNNSKLLRDSNVTLNIASPALSTSSDAEGQSTTIVSSTPLRTSGLGLPHHLAKTPLTRLSLSPGVAAGSPFGSPFRFTGPSTLGGGGGISSSNSSSSSSTIPSGAASSMQMQVGLPAWKQRAETVRKELSSAASLKAKLMDVEAQAQERLVRLMQQENEIKEHVSRMRVLQLQAAGSQKKELELTEQMEKQTAKYRSQEKVHLMKINSFVLIISQMYEEALETIQKDNEALEGTIRGLRQDIKRMEEQLKEAEMKKAEQPALEVVSGEVRSLKSALLHLRRQNSQLKAEQGRLRLLRMLPDAISEKEVAARAAIGGWPGSKSASGIGSGISGGTGRGGVGQWEQDQAVPVGPMATRSGAAELQRTYGNVRRLVKEVKQQKANVKVLDLTALGEPSQRWARQQLQTARLVKRCEETKEKLTKVLMSTQPDGLAMTDFAAFPSEKMVRRLQHVKPTPIGKLVLPVVANVTATTTTTTPSQSSSKPASTATSTTSATETAGVEAEMKNLLMTLRKKEDTTKAVLGPQQLRRIHSLLV